MVFKRAYLLLGDTWHSNPRTLDSESNAFAYPEGEEQLVSYLSREGAPAGWTLYALRTPVLPPFWIDNVKRVLLQYAPNSTYEYTTRYALIEIHPHAIEAIARLQAVPCSEQYDSLATAVFPDLIGERIPAATSARPYFVSVLYLEPLNDIKDEPAPDTVQAWAKQFLPFLCSHAWGWPPTVFRQFLLTPGKGCGGMDTEAVAISFRQTRHSEAETYVPRVIFDLLSFMDSVRILRHLGSRVRRLPFYQLSIDQYLKQLRPTETLLDTYATRYLNDRIVCYDEAFLIERVSRAVEEHTRSNFLASCGSNEAVTVGIDRAEQYVHYGQIEFLRDEVKLLLQVVEREATTFTNRERLIAEYLRDAATAEVNRSNLGLQKTVKSLTWATVFIGVVAIIVSLLGLLPEGAKVILLQRIGLQNNTLEKPLQRK